MASNNWEGVSSAFKRERKGSSGALLVGGMLQNLTGHSVVCVAVMLQVDSVDFFDALWCCYYLFFKNLNGTGPLEAMPHQGLGSLVMSSIAPLAASIQKSIHKSIRTCETCAGKFPVTYDFGSHRWYQKVWKSGK